MRQSNTYTTRIDGNLVRTPKSVTKGKALILAREILGPSAILFTHLTLFVVGVPGAVASGKGSSWEQALEIAKESPEAKAWSEKQIEVSKEIALAVNAANKAQIEYLQSLRAPIGKPRMPRFMGSKPCGWGIPPCKRLISANKSTCWEHA